MNIKTILKILASLISVFSIVFVISIYFSFQNYRVAVQKSEAANSIVVKIFERKLLADEYLAHPGERAKTQWFSKQEDIKKLTAVSENTLTTDIEKELIAIIKSGLTGSQQAFIEAIDVYDQKTATTSSELVERKARISSILAFRAQETITAATALANNYNKSAERALQLIIYLFSTVALTFFIILLISFRILIKKVFNPIFSVTATAEEIAAGNLDAQVNIKGSDEIARLGTAFNAMTKKLKSYNAELEEKVELRTKELEIINQKAEVRNVEAERLNKVMIGRELQMIELKKENEQLKIKVNNNR